MSLAGEGQLLVGLSGEGEPLMGLAGEGGRKTPLSLEEEWHLRLIVFVSATLSLAGTSLVLVSMYRFRELSKRFFAMRLIGYLAVADGFASIFNMCGVLVDTAYPAADGAPGDSPSPLCEVQAVGLLYFNLASIFWTSCFARTQILSSRCPLHNAARSLASAAAAAAPCPLTDLPLELLARFISRCDPADIARVAAVSLLFHGRTTLPWPDYPPMAGLPSHGWTTLPWYDLRRHFEAMPSNWQTLGLHNLMAPSHLPTALPLVQERPYIDYCEGAVKMATCCIL